jgi:hypothetical protein
LVGDGRSVFSINTPGGRISFVVDDVSGRVVLRCTSMPSMTQLITQTETRAGCDPYNAVLVAGFIGGVNQTVSLGVLGLSVGLLKYPTGIDTSGITGKDPDPTRPVECEYTEAYKGSSLISVVINGSDTYRYTCVIPLAANSSGWSGSVQMSAGVTLENLLNPVRVCRYQYPDAPLTDPNRRNVQAYRNVTQSLFNQNYVVAVGSRCESIDSTLLVEHSCTPGVLGGCRRS